MCLRQGPASARSGHRWPNISPSALSRASYTQQEESRRLSRKLARACSGNPALLMARQDGDPGKIREVSILGAQRLTGLSAAGNPLGRNWPRLQYAADKTGANDCPQTAADATLISTAAAI